MADPGSSYWQTLEHLFHGALKLPPGERQNWLETQSGVDPELLGEALALLSAHEHEHSRVDRAVSETARDIRENVTMAEGRRLGPYRVLKRLGAGGMGAVYLAERDDKEYRRKVAIKVIRGFPGDSALERLRQERQILADLSHPNIARLLDGGSTEDGQPYLVLEYIDGVPIVDWCRENKLGLEARIHLMLDLCDAVHYAHQHLVIHRDIKPGNVLIAQAGARMRIAEGKKRSGGGRPRVKSSEPASPAGGRPMLLDFGIAKLTKPDADETTRSARFYSPGFASPEQLAGKPVTTASDIYSLGRLLLALLDVDVRDDATRDGDEPVFRRAAWKRELPRDLAAIADQATREEAERRYPTATALREDLVRFLEGRPVEAVANHFGYRLGKFIRRNRVAVAAATIAIVIGAGLLWRLVVEYERARTAEATARTEAMRAEQTADFVLNILGSIEPEYADGADTALMQRVLEDAAARAPMELAAQPSILSDIQSVIGRTYMNIGVYDRAREHLTLAAELARDLPGSRQFLGVQRTLAENELQIGDYEAALKRIEPVLETATVQLKPDDPLTLEARHLKASLLMRQYDNEPAEAIIRDLIAQTADATDPRLVRLRFESLLTLARLHANLGRLEQGHRRFEQVRSQAAAWDDPAASALLIAALNGQALVFLQQQQGEQAEPLLRENLALTERRYGADHPRVSVALSYLGSALRQQDRLDEARPLFERALVLALEAYGPERPDTVGYQHNLARVLRDQGDVAAAAELQRAALANVDAAFPPDHPMHGSLRLSLGKSELALGNAEAAANRLREAEAFLAQSYGPDDRDTIEARDTLAEAEEIIARERAGGQ